MDMDTNVSDISAIELKKRLEDAHGFIDLDGAEFNPNDINDGVDTGEHAEVTRLFYTRERTEHIFHELRGLVTTIWILIASIQIVAMQIGFMFIESGIVQNKNKINVLLSNILATFVGIIGFYMMGFAFSNHANGGVVGNGPFYCLGVNTDGLLRFVFQFSYAITSSTIVSGCMLERLPIGTYVAFIFIMNCMIYPVPASWIWGGGWL